MTEIQLSFRKVQVKNIKFLDMATLDPQNKEGVAKKTLLLGSDLDEQEANNLSIKDGIELTKAINELNGFSAFQ